MKNDEELMLASKGGDRVAYGLLYRRHLGSIKNFIYRFTGSRELSEELTQDVFVKIYEKRESYETTAKFTTYLYRVATNTALNAIGTVESRTRSLETHTTSDGRDIVGETADERIVDPHDAVVGKERFEMIMCALQSLKAIERQVLLLSRIDGFGYREIAEMTGKTEMAVKLIVFRAKANLAGILDKEGIA